MVFSLASVPEVASAYTPTEEDLEYLEWQHVTSGMQSDNVGLIAAEMENKSPFDCDWEYVRTLAILTYNHAETALIEIDQFEVSAELKHIKTEGELSLIDQKWAAHHFKEASDDYISGDTKGASDNLGKSVEYLKSSIVHAEKGNALIDALPTTPIQESPSYEAIFAIGSLLAVAYLVLRRKK